jgi:hypothetical protein
VGIVPPPGKRYLDSFLVVRMRTMGSLIVMQRDRTCVNIRGESWQEIVVDSSWSIGVKGNVVAA